MALDVRWTEEAEVTFDTIVALIIERWGESSAEKFRHKTRRTLTNISRQPLIFPEVEIENVHKAVITKQSSVFYEIYQDRIVLLFFWDNRQDPLFF